MAAFDRAHTEDAGQIGPPVGHRKRRWSSIKGSSRAVRDDVSGLRVLRHRLFESNFPIVQPLHEKHPKVHTFDRRKSHFGKTDEWKDFVQVTGGGNCTLAAARDAMGIDWMTKNEINESIPPVYTLYVGLQLLRHLSAIAAPTSMRRNA